MELTRITPSDIEVTISGAVNTRSPLTRVSAIKAVFSREPTFFTVISKGLSWFIHGRSKGFLKIPSILKSVVHAMKSNARIFTPLRNSLSYSVNGLRSVTHHIVHLFFLSSPSAVFRSVIAVVVNAIKRVLGCRFFTHIGKEVKESILTKPSVHNLDASTTVTRIGSVLGAIASSFHSSVRVVFVSVERIATVSEIALSGLLAFVSSIHRNIAVKTKPSVVLGAKTARTRHPDNLVASLYATLFFPSSHSSYFSILNKELTEV